MGKFSINVNEYDKNHNFEIYGVSYAGRPKNNTAMFVGKKVDYLLGALLENGNYLVFIDDDVVINKKLLNNNVFIKSKNPQYEYVNVALKFQESIVNYNLKRKYTYRENGIVIGENVTIGKGVLIEPLVFIDHDVIIGDNTIIRAGAKIRNAKIGNNCVVNHNVVIGALAINVIKFNDQIIRIPMLGKVVIGNNVDIGDSSFISVGIASDTIIKDNVKIGELNSIGHDCIIGDSSIIVSHVVIGGFVEIGNNSYIALGAIIKNRLKIGNNVFICMGSNVVRNIGDNIKVFGNPAKIMSF